MRALVWIVEDTWQVTVAEAAAYLPADAEITILHVADVAPEGVAAGARHGLLGRRPPRLRAAAEPLRAISEQAARDLLAEAGTRLGAPPRSRPAVAASSGRWWPPPRAWTCSSWRATATAGTWAAQPGPGGPLRGRPRPLPRPARLARCRAAGEHDPAAAARSLTRR